MAAQATSIADLLYQISQANVNNQGLVDWDGANGLKQITENLSASLGARGILYFNSTTQMSLAGGGDSAYAICNTENGLAFYKFFPNIDNSVPFAVTSTSAGQWRPIYATQNALSGVWVEGGANKDIIPAVGYENSGVAIGKNSVTEGLWLEIEGLDSEGFAKAAKLPTITTVKMNSMPAYVDNSLILNSNDKMLLRYDDTESNFKSAGVFSDSYNGSVGVGTTAIIIDFTSSQHVTTYKVLISATHADTAALLALGYYITGKTNTSFRVAFPTPVATAGYFNIDFQISH